MDETEQKAARIQPPPVRKTNYDRTVRVELGHWCSACGANGGREPYLETRPNPRLGSWQPALLIDGLDEPAERGIWVDGMRRTDLEDEHAGEG